MNREYIVCRVDRAPMKYYGGSDGGCRTRTTTEKKSAARMTLDEARVAVFALKLDHGGVWSVRPAMEEADECWDRR